MQEVVELHGHEQLSLGRGRHAVGRGHPAADDLNEGIDSTLAGRPPVRQPVCGPGRGQRLDGRLDQRFRLAVDDDVVVEQPAAVGARL
nr:hypothetical protein [Pedococcus sp. 5OH_020]